VTFWKHFFRLLRWRPGQALAAAYWHLTRRKVRARNRLREGIALLPGAYGYWIETIERKSELARGLPAIMQGWHRQPCFAIVLHSPYGHAEEQLARSIKSVERQAYPVWTIFEKERREFDASLAAADGDYLVPLKVGDELSEMALFRLAEAFQAEPSAAILYGDQDELDSRERRARPWFKPRWNEEMFLAQDFLSSAVAIEVGLVRRLFASEPELDLSALLLAATAAAEGPIVHVPHILSHIDAAAADRAPGSRLEAVARHLEPLGARCTAGQFGTVKVQWPLPDDPPTVSIIIPTRDKIELLRPCVEGVLQRTNYPKFEILVVDNGSSAAETLSYLARIGEHPAVRVLPYDRPYNYSAINNFAVREAPGPYVCLLNNDTEVIEPDWLTEMMRYAVRPIVGAVGAKLLYDDGSIQHAGVVIGIGEAAGHAHRFQPADQPGYFRQAHVAQFVSAVTAACLVVEKTKFEAVGGLDERELAVAFNDVDLCLKLEAAGWRNVYVPHAVLLHHESRSRGKDSSPKNRDRYMQELRVLQDRWGTRTYADPLHNPNLDRYSEKFIIRL
jgi:O-antigen biosynthesis protein